jgi:hypothetical protein
MTTLLSEAEIAELEKRHLSYRGCTDAEYTRLLATARSALELAERVRELEEERRKLGEAWHQWRSLTASPTSVREVQEILDTIEAETRGKGEK